MTLIVSALSPKVTLADDFITYCSRGCWGLKGVLAIPNPTERSVSSMMHPLRGGSAALAFSLCQCNWRIYIYIASPPSPFLLDLLRRTEPRPTRFLKDVRTAVCLPDFDITCSLCNSLLRCAGPARFWGQALPISMTLYAK